MMDKILHIAMLTYKQNMKKLNGTKTIAIDSNVLTYFVEATKPGYNSYKDDGDLDKENVHKEMVASLQIPLYSKWYAIMPTVRSEYRKIKEMQRLSLHISVDQLFKEYGDAAFCETEVKKRAEYFNRHHKGIKRYKDCMIAAEAEFLLDTTVLLSNDNDFIKNVSPLTNGLLIMRPTEFIDKFGISNNELRISPAETNPLYHETWWRF